MAIYVDKWKGEKQLKIWVGVGIGWIVLIVSIMVYSNSYKGKTIPIQTNFPELSYDSHVDSGPEDGAVLLNEEPPEQLVTRFMQYVNAGLIDEASGLVDPNALMDYTSRHKEMKTQDALNHFVMIFKKGEAKGFKVSKTSSEGAITLVYGRVELKTGETLVFDFNLRLFQESSHGEGGRYWNILSIDKNSK